MNKEEIIRSVELTTLETLEKEKIKLLAEIEDKITQLSGNIKLHIKKTITENPINSYNYNSLTNTLPYDYYVLSKFYPNIPTLVSEELTLRNLQQNEQKTVENKKIYLKLSKMLERLKEESAKLDAEIIRLHKKNQLDTQSYATIVFKAELKRLREIKYKYDILQS